MSTTIDEKVVSIQFDNQKFEKNVSTTMSTLDKLKEKLSFRGASKGLEEVNAAANKTDMSGLAKGVETVHAKFSALEVMGVTALANITNSAVNAGKRMLSALTIDPIKTGFQEYETQMNSVQTILANTSSKGSTLEDVNNALDTLNTYADKTIYNFTEMTRNIGTFTAAGVDLDTSVSAIQGIANLAAVSGSTSQQASTAMYQLSQALATGTVKLQDWNSVVNAGMGGEVFQNALMRTAAAMDGAAEDVDAWKAANVDAFGSFRDSLTQGGWLTTDVLTATLNQFTMAAEEGSKEWEEYKKSLKEQGYTDAQVEEILKMANTATDAATKVKTFTQLWDVMKEAAQSGWAQTWKIIVGDFEEAKALLTPLADFFTGAIGKMSDARNDLLESALGRKFTDLAEKVKSVAKPMESAGKAIEAVGKSVEEYEAVVGDIISGKWGNGEERYKALTEAGYDWAHAQNLVNEKLGDSTRHTTKYTDTQKESNKEQQKAVELNTAQIAKLAEMEESELRRLGYTDKQIKAFKELKEMADKMGISVKFLLDNADEIDGRWLLINSFKNVGQSLVTIFKSIGEAWRDAFPPMSADTLFNIIAGIHKFSTYLVITEGTADKLTRTLKGVFAIFDIIATLTGSVFKIGVQIIQELLKALGYMDIDILSVTANVGDAIVAFRDWLDEHNLISKAISKVVPFLVKMGKALVDLVKQLWELPAVQGAVESVVGMISSLDDITLDDVIRSLKSFGKRIKEVFLTINDHFGGVPGDILSGLAGGLKNGIVTVLEAIANVATSLIEKFKEILGIHSPSTVFIAIGGFVIAGLIAGLLGGEGLLGDTMQDIVGKITEFFGNIDWSKIFASGMSVGLLVIAKKLTDILNNFSSFFGGMGSIMEGVGDVASNTAELIAKSTKKIKKILNSFSKVLNSIAFKQNTEGIKNIAVSLLLLVGAIAILTFLDVGKLWNAVAVIAALSGIMLGLSFALSKMNQAGLEVSKEGIKINGLKSTLLALGTALLLMAIVVKIIGGMDPEKAKQGFLGLAGLVVAMGAVFAAYGLLVKGKAAQNIDKAGKMMRKMATTLLLLVVVIKLVSFLDKDELIKGAICLSAFALFTLGLVAATSIAGKNIDKVGGTLIKIAIAMGLMVGVIKLMSLLSNDELIKGGICMAAFVVFVGALVAVTKIGKDNVIAKVGTTILGISVAMLLMVGVIKLISSMEWDALIKGAIGVGFLSVIMYALIKMVKSVGPEAPKLAGTLLAMSLALGILAAVSLVLSLMSIEGLAKGIIAVGMLGAILALLIHYTKGAQDVKGSLIGMAVAIGVMAAAVAVLSFIDTSKLFGATIALGTLMAMFALIEHASANVTNAMGTLIVMTAAIAVLTTALYIVAKLPVEQSLGAAISLSILMAAMAGVLFIISKIGVTIGNAFKGAVGLTLLAVPMLAFVGVLALMQNVSNALANVNALVKLMTALTLLLIPLSLIGAATYLTGGAVLLGIAALLAMAVPLVAFVGILAIMQNIQNATTNATLLTSLMTTMVNLLVKVALVAPLAILGVTAMAAMTALMVGIGAMVIAVGALMQEFPALESFIDTGIPVLVKLSNGIGQIISGFATGLVSGLPEIGSQLSMFMLNAMPFIIGAKMVDESVLAGIGILTGAILALTAADLIEGIVSFLNGGTSFATLGTELSMFMLNAMPFVMLSSQIDPAIMGGVKALAEAILILTGANMLENITKFIGGESSLATFGSQLGELATGLKSFVTNLGTFTEDQVITVDCAGKAIKALANAASSIPNEGGWAAKLLGENSLATFGSYLPQLGTDLKGFVTNLGTFDESTVTTVDCAGRAIKTLADAANSIPNEGGLWAKIVGENSLATFGAKLPNLGKHLNQFIVNLGSFGEESIATVDCACRAIKTLAAAANSIPNEGGLWAKLAGDNSLATFAGKLPGIATNINKFVANLGTFSEGGITSVNAACRAIKAIASVCKEDMDIGNVSDFGKKLETLGKKIGSFTEKVSEAGGENISSAVTKTKELISMAKSVASVNIESLSTFGKSLEKVAKDGVKGFVKEFSGESPKSKAKKATEAMLDSAIDGAEKKKPTVKKKFKSIAEAAVDGLSIASLKTDAKDAGKDLVKGFASGIKAQTFEAEAKAKAMAKAALQAAEEALGIESPSKEFYKVGSFAGQGLTNALGDYESRSYKAGYGVAEYAKNGLSKALASVNDLLNRDMDAQPTIRPVLDLSEVAAGAGSISGLFNTPSVGVNDNLNAINSMMSGHQNGGNGDIISAIDKLRKDIGNVGGTSYNFNGVSYNGDSDVADAIKVLTRAAIRERRI